MSDGAAEVERLRARVVELEAALRDRGAGEASGARVDRAQLDAIVESSADLVCSVDHALRVLAFNSAFARYHRQAFGVEPAVGAPLCEGLPEERRASIEAAFRRALGGERFVSARGPFVEAGVVREYEATFGPILRDGVVIGAAGVSRDVTDRARAERIRRESEARLCALMESTSDPIFSLDRASRLVTFNTAFEAVWVRTLGAAPRVGDDVRAVASRFYREFDAAMRAALAGGRVTFDCGPVDGDRHFQVSLDPVRSGDAVVGVSAVARDVTARRLAELALRESEAKLRDVMESTKVAIFAVDAAQRVSTHNARWADLCRSVHGVDVTRGAPLLSLVPPPARDMWAGLIASALRGERISFEYAVGVDGAVRHFDVSLHPLEIDGDVTGAAAFCHEITRAKRTEEALRRADAELRAIADNGDDALCALDRDGRLIRFNATFERGVRARTGVAPVLGAAILDELGVEEGHDVRGWLARALNGERCAFRAVRESRAYDVWLNPIFAAVTVSGVAVLLRERRGRGGRARERPSLPRGRGSLP